MGQVQVRKYSSRTFNEELKNVITLMKIIDGMKEDRVIDEL
jgi:hypothetical protein